MSITEQDRAPLRTAEVFPLSHTQEFLSIFDQGDDAGPFGPRYNIVVGWRVRGPLEVGILQQAMDDVVARHDVLRVTITRGAEGSHQAVQPAGPAQLRVVDLPSAGAGERQLAAEQFLSDVEAGSYDSRTLPHLRVILGRFDDQDAVLALIVHHTAGDGWSMHVLLRDIAHCYAIRKGLDVEPLPEPRSYREYVARTRENFSGETAAAAREYWRENLAGARILGLPTDHPRSAGLEKKSPVQRFEISRELTTAIAKHAKATRSTPFIVLFAAYNTLMYATTGATDVVIPTLTSGRTDPDFHDTVGPFFNFVLLRTDLTGCATFRDVLDRTRRSCIEAYTRDIPFTQILEMTPEVMAPLTEDTLAACALQVWQFAEVMDRKRVGDLEYSEVRGRRLSQPDGTDIPDGALLTLDLDPSGQAFGNIAYNSNLYTEQSMLALTSHFRQILHTALTDPNTPLASL
jgi:hypothetical protein